MTEALRDPVWQFVGVVISLAALLVAIAAIRFQLVRKSLAFYHSLDNPAFFVVNRELRERLHITFDGREVQQLSTFDISIFNDGNASIAPTDFVQPISVEFPESNHIFGVLTTQTSPSNLGVNVTRQGTRFVVEPLLLNPGDQFTLQFLVEHSTASHLRQPTIEGRVTGVKVFSRKQFRLGARHRVPAFLEPARGPKTARAPFRPTLGPLSGQFTPASQRRYAPAAVSASTYLRHAALRDAVCCSNVIATLALI